MARARLTLFSSQLRLSRISRSLPLLAALGSLPIALSAHDAWAIGEVTGRLGGVVQIQTGAKSKDGLAGVTVTIKSKALLGGKRSVTTQEDGSYRFDSLPPGTYTLTVRVDGFIPTEQRNIVVLAGQLAAADVDLEVGQETTKIVEKRNPVLNPESAVTTTVLDNTKVQRTPVFRQVQAMAQLAPGVGPGNSPSVRGGLSRYTRYLVDGLDTSDIVSGGISSPMNFDAVEQFSLFSGAMDAEYNSLGLVQNMVTRSGGNKFTLDASFTLQPTAFNSNIRYGAQLPQQNGTLLYDDRPPAVRDFYSVNANIGGPIVKDRLWFFTSFQFNYNRAMATIPPFPWYGTTEDTDRYRYTYTYLGRAKLTWQATASTRISLSFNIDRNQIQNSLLSTTVTEDAERMIDRGGEWLVLLVDSALSSKWLFQMQAGFTTKRSLEDTQKKTEDGLPDRITASRTLRTADQFNGVTYGNSSGGWNDETKYRIQVDPTLMYSTTGKSGTHNIKGGVQFAYMRYSHNVGVAGGLRWTDNLPGTPCNPADPSTYASCNQVTEFPQSLPQGGQAGAGLTTTAEAYNLGFFLQDRWTIKRFLTVVPGMRFDTGLLYDFEGKRLGTLFGYGPRLSVIYDVFHNRSTLLSAHYGRHNDVGNAYIADQGNPFQVSTLKRWDNTAKAFNVQNSSGGPGGQLFAESVKPPSLDEVGIGIRREVVEQTVLGVDYTYRLYDNLWVNEEINQIWDPAGNRVVGYRDGMRRRIFEAGTPDDAQRTYHGLDFWLQGNPGNFGIIASYTLAFSDGNVSDYFSAYRQNPRMNAFFFGALSDNYRHTLKGAIDYSFSFGLNVSARIQYRTGAPQWRVFQSPEDNGFGLYRSPRGTNIGARANDPTVWAEFKLPDQFTLDLQGSFSLEKWTGQRIDLMVMIYNVLGGGTPTGIDSRTGNTFGAITGRLDNLNAQVILRYRI
jgi:hypothetical protein